MKRHSFAASLALAALVVLEFAGPVAASTFSVLNVADDGFGSLRAAIAAANAQPGADVIHFTRPRCSARSSCPAARWTSPTTWRSAAQAPGAWPSAAAT